MKDYEYYTKTGIVLGHLIKHCEHTLGVSEDYIESLIKLSDETNDRIAKSKEPTKIEVKDGNN